MKSIADLISRLAVPGMRQSMERGMIAEIVAEVTGVAITARQVKFESGTLTLAVAPIMKSALILKRAELVSAFQARNLTLSAVR